MHWFTIAVGVATFIGTIFALKQWFFDPLRRDIKEEFNAVRREMKEGFAKVDKQFEKVDKQFEKVDTEIKDMKKDINKLNIKLNRIEDRIEFSGKIVYIKPPEDDEPKEN